MLRYIYLFLLLFVIFGVFAQNGKLDSLQKLIATFPDDTAKVNAINQMVLTYREQNNFEAFILANKAIDIAEKLNYSKGLAMALEHLGWINYHKGSYSEAFELSERALKIFEELQDQIGISRSLINLAAISYEQEKFDDAINKFKRAYEISSIYGEVYTMVRSLNNISFSYLALKELDSAKWYAEEAIKVSMDSLNYMPAFSLRLLGDIVFELNDAEQALEYYNHSLKISNETSNYSIKSSNLHRIGKVFASMGKYKEAIDILNENLLLTQQNGYLDELVRTHKLLSDIYIKLDKSDLALQHLQDYLVFYDSTNNQKNNDRIAFMQARFESDIKQSKIDLLTKDTQLKAQEIVRQQSWRYFYIIAITFFFLMVAFLFRTNWKFKRINSELKLKNDEISKQTRQLEGLSVTKDKLLSIISHDLRSPLSGLHSLLNLFKDEDISMEEMRSFVDSIDARLTVLTEDLDNILQWTQTQLHGLQVQKSNVVINSIVEEVLQINKDSIKGKSIIVQNELSHGIVAFFDPNHLKIIIRNIVANAIKFTNQGGEIFFKVLENRERIVLQITDTGVGMDQQDLDNLFNPGKHFSKAGTCNEQGLGVGLLLTKEFIDKNDAKIEVRSKPGEGTTFSITFEKALSI